MEQNRIMATDIQSAFEKSIAELGFESLLDDAEVSPEAVKEQESQEDAETEQIQGNTADEGVVSLEDEDNDGDNDEVDAEDVPYIEVSKNSKLRLPDGSIVDAGQAILLQSDYTRKTQEISEQRKILEEQKRQVQEAAGQYKNAYSQMREWYESRASRPSDWLSEIASQTQDPTATVAQALYTMAQQGLLDPKFVETFGIDSGEIAQVAKTSNVESELEELKRWRYEQEVSANTSKAVQERAVVYEQEWERIKSSNNLSFNDRLSESEAKKELLSFALNNNLTRSLFDAYDLMTVRKPKLVSKQTQPDAEIAAKKRASRAVSAKTNSAPPVKINKSLSTREAILQSMQEIAGA
jgi:hypothetical protein